MDQSGRVQSPAQSGSPEWMMTKFPIHWPSLGAVPITPGLQVGGPDDVAVAQASRNPRRCAGPAPLPLFCAWRRGILAAAFGEVSEMSPTLRGLEPPHLLHLTTSLDMGGSQTMLAKLVELSAGGARQPRHAAISLMRPGAIAGRLQSSGCPVYDLGMTRGIPSLVASVRMLRIISAVRPDLLQGWMYHGNLAASVAELATGTPVVWNVRHSLNAPQCEKKSTRLVLRLSSRLAHRTRAIIYNSHIAADEHEAIGFPADRTIVIPNGFDCTRFHPTRSRRVDVRALFSIPEGPMLVCMAARLHPMKDHTRLVEAVGRARSAGHDLHLLLVGPGLETPPRALSQAIARTLPPDRVTLVGERSDLDEWLAGVDVLALPSAWGESFPNVLGEAMACGVACVATRVGDCQHILGQSGLVVAPSDTEQLAGALVRLASMGAQNRRRLGDVGRARVVEHFSLESVGHQYRRLYERLLNDDANIFTSLPTARPEAAAGAGPA